MADQKYTQTDYEITDGIDDTVDTVDTGIEGEDLGQENVLSEEAPASFVSEDGTEYSQEDLNKFIGAYKNDKKWKQENQRRSAELKKAEKSLSDREGKFHAKQVKGQVNAGWESQAELALARMMRRYPDLDMGRIDDFKKQYPGISHDGSNYDKYIEVLYLAEKGSHVDYLVSEARADVIRKAKARGERGGHRVGPGGISREIEKDVGDMDQDEYRDFLKEQLGE